jgi:hypothetical protein
MMGFAWTLGGVFFFLTMEGIATPISSRAVLLAATAWFAGPICLTMGRLRILNGMVGDSMYDAFHLQPLQDAVPYQFYAVVSPATFLRPAGSVVRCGLEAESPESGVYTSGA